MTTFYRDSVRGPRVEPGGRRIKDKTLLSYTVASFSFLLPLGKPVEARCFADLIDSYSNSAQSKACVELLRSLYL